jgi:hypothetical protein
MEYICIYIYIYIYICMDICDTLNGILDPSRKLRRMDSIDEKGEVFIFVYMDMYLYVYVCR